jgi:two-component system CheB/CheR fusion protein
MVMVQEPLSAEYQDMPRSAVGTGLADFLLPVEQMGSPLLDYVRHAGLGRAPIAWRLKARR